MRLPLVRRAFAAASSVWALLLPIAQYAATRVHASTPTHVFAFLVYAVGTLVCHQKPERSFHLWGAQLPVCARCTGIYLGAALAVAAIAVARRPTTARRPRDSRWRSPARLAVLAALPTAATLLFEWSSGVTPSNTIRFAAGLPLGVLASWLVLAAPAQVN